MVASCEPHTTVLLANYFALSLFTKRVRKNNLLSQTLQKDQQRVICYHVWEKSDKEGFTALLFAKRKKNKRANSSKKETFTILHKICAKKTNLHKFLVCKFPTLEHANQQLEHCEENFQKYSGRRKFVLRQKYVFYHFKMHFFPFLFKNLKLYACLQYLITFLLSFVCFFVLKL